VFLVASAQEVRAEPLDEVRWRELVWKDPSPRAMRLLGPVGRHALAAACPPGVEPRRLALKEHVILEGAFSQGQWQQGRWIFGEAPLGGVSWALTGAGCRVSYQQRRLRDRRFSRLEWHAKGERKLELLIAKEAPFGALAQSWLQDAASPGRWIDRYRLLRPATQLGAVRRHVQLPASRVQPFSLWLHRQDEPSDWRMVSAPRFVVHGPARVDIDVRRVGVASQVCLKVKDDKSCQLSPDAQVPRLEGRALRYEVPRVHGQPVSTLLRWRLLLPPGPHQLRLMAPRLLARVRVRGLSKRWGLSATPPKNIVVYAPGAAVEQRELQGQRSRQQVHWLPASAQGRELSPLALMVEAQGPVAPMDWRWWPLGKPLAATPGLTWLDENNQAALWVPAAARCELRLGKGSSWHGAPRNALSRFVFTGSAGTAGTWPEMRGCSAWLRVRGRRAESEQAGELLLQRLWRVPFKGAASFSLSPKADQSAITLSWPLWEESRRQEKILPVTVAVELASGQTSRFVIRPAVHDRSIETSTAVDRSRWSKPMRWVFAGPARRLRVSSPGVFAVRVASRMQGAAQKPSTSRLGHVPLKGEALVQLRGLTRRIAKDPHNAHLRLQRAGLLEALGAPQLAASDYLWARFAAPDELAHVAAHVQLLTTRHLFGEGHWWPLTAGWLRAGRTGVAISNHALELSATRDYLALVPSRPVAASLERIWFWRSAILGGQILSPRQRLAAYRSLEGLPPQRQRDPYFWPLRALSRWQGIALVGGQARATKRIWPIGRKASALDALRDALFVDAWPLQRLARLSAARELALPPRNVAREIPSRCLQRRPERVGRPCRFELVNEGRKVVAFVKVPDGGVAKLLRVPAGSSVLYLRIPVESTALQEVLLPEAWALRLLREAEQKVWRLDAGKVASITLLGPSVLRLRVQRATRKPVPIRAQMMALGGAENKPAVQPQRQHLEGLTDTTEVEFPVEVVGPCRVQISAGGPIVFRPSMRVPRVASVEPLSDRLFAARAAKAQSGAAPSLPKEAAAPLATLAARPIQRPPLTLSVGTRFGAEEISGDPEQKLRRLFTLQLGLSSRPGRWPLWVDFEGRLMLGEDAPVFLARAGLDWYLMRGPVAFSLVADVTLARGSPDDIGLTALGGVVRAQGELWLTPLVQLRAHLRYAERDALSGGVRPGRSYGHVPALWSAYRQDHPRALGGLLMLRLVLGRNMRYGMSTWLTSNASTDQALVDHAGLGAHLDAVLPSFWARLGTDLERRFSDAHRDAPYFGPEAYARGTWTLWPAGYWGLELVASVRYQFHFENVLLTVGLRAFLSRDRGLHDLRPSRTLYKPATSWWQDRSAVGSYGHPGRREAR